MRNSKILDIFRSFSRQEVRGLLELVQSPYFNKNEQVLALAEVMVELAKKGFPEKWLESKLIFERAFPKEVFDEKRFSYLTSDLLKLCEQFIALRAIEEDGVAFDLYRLRACHDRALQKSYNRNFKQLQKELEAPAKIDANYLWQKYQFYQLAEDRFAQSGSRTADPYLQQAVDDLDNFYLSQKLRYSGVMLARQSTLKEAYTFRFLQENDFQQIEVLEQSQLTQLYGLAYQLLQSQNDEVLLTNYTNQIRHFAPQLTNATITELFNHAINYCIRHIRKGQSRFTAILLSLYQENLEKGYLLEEGILSPWNYKNIVKLGLGLRQLDWVADFVENYTAQLPDAAQSDAYHFNLADISYHRKDYNEALAHLQHTEFTDVHYALGAKTMLIKIFYETEEIEPMLSLLSSFQLLLIRNKIIGQGTKEAYLNFIRFTKKLQRAQRKEILEKLEQQIRSSTSLSDRTWLLTQLNQKNPATS